MTSTTQCPEHCPLCKGIIAPLISEDLIYWCDRCKLHFQIKVLWKVTKGDKR